MPTSCCSAIIPVISRPEENIMELAVLSGIAAVFVIAVEFLDYAR